eukprot:7175750-Karenia_brevis.AAC.1
MFCFFCWSSFSSSPLLCGTPSLALDVSDRPLGKRKRRMRMRMRMGDEGEDEDENRDEDEDEDE